MAYKSRMERVDASLSEGYIKVTSPSSRHQDSSAMALLIYLVIYLVKGLKAFNYLHTFLIYSFIPLGFSPNLRALCCSTISTRGVNFSKILGAHCPLVPIAPPCAACLG